jgi:hypothetical protein
MRCRRASSSARARAARSSAEDAADERAGRGAGQHAFVALAGLVADNAA